jgi:hypothetical protein
VSRAWFPHSNLSPTVLLKCQNGRQKDQDGETRAKMHDKVFAFAWEEMQSDGPTCCWSLWRSGCQSRDGQASVPALQTG